MLRRGFLMVPVIAGLLAVGGYFAWTAGHDAGSAHGHLVSGGFHLGAGFVFMAMFLLFLSLFISKIFFWRRGPGAYAGHWSTRWEEWHERAHREHDERGERGGSPEPPAA